MIATYVFVETSPAAAGTAPSSAPVQGSANYAPGGVAAGQFEHAEDVDIVAELVGATGGTLDVVVQSSTSATASTWYDVVHFSQLAAGAAAVIYRVSLTMTAQPTSAAPVTIGKDLAPALAAGTIVQTLGFNALRLVMTAGSGTTAGAKVKVVVTAVTRGHR